MFTNRHVDLGAPRYKLHPGLVKQRGKIWPGLRIRAYVPVMFLKNAYCISLLVIFAW